MKLTRASSYALHAVAQVAAHAGARQALTSHQLAAARGIPERFLLKVLKPLVSARLLQALKGPNGGYRLARPAAEISLLDIIEAVDGPIRGQAVPVCSQGQNLDQRLEEICDRTAAAMRRHLQKVHLLDFVTIRNSNRPEQPAQPSLQETPEEAREWSLKNRRRGELIDKEIAGQLTPKEQEELEQLQEEVTRYVLAKAPRPLDYLRRLDNKLRARRPRLAGNQSAHRS
jgi:Rrf2 family protein